MALNDNLYDELLGELETPKNTQIVESEDESPITSDETIENDDEVVNYLNQLVDSGQEEEEKEIVPEEEEEFDLYAGDVDDDNDDDLFDEYINDDDEILSDLENMFPEHSDNYKRIKTKSNINFEKDFASAIAQKESGGNYQAQNKTTKATGKYQFMPMHLPKIRKITGVNSMEEFKNNPQAQEQFFNYWEQNVLNPEATALKRLAPRVLLAKLKALVHFRGFKGAKDYLTGKLGDKPESYNTSISSYTGITRQEGGYANILDKYYGQTNYGVPNFYTPPQSVDIRPISPYAYSGYNNHNSYTPQTISNPIVPRQIPLNNINGLQTKIPNTLPNIEGYDKPLKDLSGLSSNISSVLDIGQGVFKTMRNLQTAKGTITDTIVSTALAKLQDRQAKKDFYNYLKNMYNESPGDYFNS